jgi:putative membrane-bound dehydrogenase-like protein
VVSAVIHIKVVTFSAEPEGHAIRETPLAPSEELETFRLSDRRLTIELVAAEPQLDSPVAVCWDADGRMFVAEMIDYPLGPTAGQIRMLEDRNGDGQYEHATVFADGLRFPNGVLAARGGLFVTAAPDLLFLRDTDGDGNADERRVAFTGFGEGNQQLRANGLTHGPDNWIYGANGRSDGVIRRPNDPPDGGVSIRGRDFRFTSDGSHFEATSGQSQFGQSHDDWGNRFLSWNTIPVRHALFEQSFLDRNPRLASRGVLDIADPQDPRIPDQPSPANVQSRTHRLLQRTVRADDLSRRRVGQGVPGQCLRGRIAHQSRASKTFDARRPDVRLAPRRARP